MHGVKIIGANIFLALLLWSNLFMLAEGLGDIFPSTNFNFHGNTTTDYDLNDGTVTISLDKMNVLWVGIDNPITAAASGVADDDLELSSNNEGIKIVKRQRGSFVITAQKPGKITLTATNRRTGRSRDVEFRVNRIPDPVVRMGKRTNGLIGSGEFRAQPGLAAWLENFDFDARCDVVSYTMYYSSKGRCPVEIQGTGGRFLGKAKSAIQQAKPGDQYAFTNVKAKCPGDTVSRKVNGLSFKVK